MRTSIILSWSVNWCHFEEYEEERDNGKEEEEEEKKKLRLMEEMVGSNQDRIRQKV